MTSNCEHSNESKKVTGDSPKETDAEDVNDVFEKLLFAEEIAEETGYQEGFEVGTKRIIEGYHLGYHRSSLLAAQLGFYYGRVQYCLDEELFGEKVIQQAKKLKKDLEAFPQSNDDSVDILTTFEDIKFKYNKLCSLAKMDPSYPEAEKLNY